MTWWQLTWDANSDDVAHSSDYELPPDLDYQVIAQGVPLPDGFPFEARILVEDDARPLADYLGNPLSWPIMSDRLYGLLEPLLESSVQAFKAPLYYEKSGDRISGYRMINVTTVIDCVDWNRSDVYRIGRRAVDFDAMCIDDKRAAGHHLFRPKRALFSIVCSDRIVDTLRGKGMTGLAFIRGRYSV